MLEDKLSLNDIRLAAHRLGGFLNPTPLIHSELLNRLFGHRFFFKAENMQKIGAFKARGALNALLWARENGKLTPEVCCVSSGNHAQAVAWAAKILNVHARVYMAKDASQIKIRATESYGAKVILCSDRLDAERAVAEDMKRGLFFIPPYDHDQVICGQGTACLEALDYLKFVHAVFAPIGGGGLLSGTSIVAKAFDAKVFGGEPEQADDAARSYALKKIQRFNATPNTICDGVKTLSMSERTFSYVKDVDGIFTISEDQVCLWTQWLTHILKLTIEPTAALSFVAALKWLKNERDSKDVLLILSGGNMDHTTRASVYEKDYLSMYRFEDLKNLT